MSTQVAHWVTAIHDMVPLVLAPVPPTEHNAWPELNALFGVRLCLSNGRSIPSIHISIDTFATNFTEITGSANWTAVGTLHYHMVKATIACAVWTAS